MFGYTLGICISICLSIIITVMKGNVHKITTAIFSYVLILNKPVIIFPCPKWNNSLVCLSHRMIRMGMKYSYRIKKNLSLRKKKNNTEHHADKHSM